MKSSERVARRLRGEEVDRPPNFDIMMAFAVHFIGQPLSRFHGCPPLILDMEAVRDDDHIRRS